jgi:serine/threonine protein phosphatase 1
MNRLLAISDIHGCYDTFYELVIRKINLVRSDKLILLGDYIDRGDKTKEVLDFIIDLGQKGYDVTPLMGNHEAMLLESYLNNDMIPLWFMNSGMTTLDSFHIQSVNNFETRYIAFFKSLRYFESVAGFYFVHAGFNDRLPDPFTDTETMIWTAVSQYGHPVFAGKTVIHGHRPKTIDFVRARIAEKSAVIPIDTGCVYDDEKGYGNLSALEVNNMNLISVKNIKQVQ